MQSADGGQAADSNGAAATQEHTKRGESNLPRGVGKLNKGKHQARASWTPEGASKATQRNIGRFETIEEAAEKVREYEDILRNGGDPWTAPVKERKCKRGEVCLPAASR